MHLIIIISVIKKKKLSHSEAQEFAQNWWVVKPWFSEVLNLSLLHRRRSAVALWPGLLLICSCFLQIYMGDAKGAHSNEIWTQKWLRWEEVQEKCSEFTFGLNISYRAITGMGKSWKLAFVRFYFLGTHLVLYGFLLSFMVGLLCVSFIFFFLQ